MSKWKMKLQSKFFVSMLSFFLIMIVVFGGACLLFSKKKLNDSSQEFAMELLEQLSDNMENNTDSLMNQCHLLKKVIRKSIFNNSMNLVYLRIHLKSWGFCFS